MKITRSRLGATLALVVSCVALTAPVAARADDGDDTGNVPAFIDRSSWG